MDESSDTKVVLQEITKQETEDEEAEEEETQEVCQPEEPDTDIGISADPAPNEDTPPQMEEADDHQVEAPQEHKVEEDASTSMPAKKTVDTEKPIELTSETIVVVDGKKCVLRVDPTTNHLVAFPFKPGGTG